MTELENNEVEEILEENAEVIEEAIAEHQEEEVAVEPEAEEGGGEELTPAQKAARGMTNDRKLSTY